MIGVGNVALDIARMLALTREELAPTDTSDTAIDAIASSPLKEIVIVGRRGPAQAAFTTPELQEMGELARRRRRSSIPPTSRVPSRRTRWPRGTSP